MNDLGMPGSGQVSFRSDASELVLSNDEGISVEAYLFDPSPAEVGLGHLFAAGETEARDGVGKELLDMTISALQKEYYRDPKRNSLASFESALHQANLVLHDAAEQGIRNWMGYFHVAVGVLAREALHVSTAGHGAIFMARRGSITELSADLSYSPITEPLRTFSQVASGTVSAGDVLFFGTSALQTAFRREDLTRIVIDHSAEHISSRLEQLYEDQQLTAALAAVVMTAVAPTVTSTPTPTASYEETPKRASVMARVTPRQPLIIERSTLRAAFAIILRTFGFALEWLRSVVWPLVIRSSKASGRAVAAASVSTGHAVGELTKQGVTRVQERRHTPSQISDQTSTSRLPKVAYLPRVRATVTNIPVALWSSLLRLPRTTKVFVVLTIVLALILVGTLSLLQRKRTEDASIQQASETLHDARTKADAAETALIYDNREQARTLLGDAETQITELAGTGVYVEEVQALQAQMLSI